MFERAARLKLRFVSDKGRLSDEDLWDLSLPQLNIIAKSLKKELSSAEEEDFLEEKNKEDIELKLRFDIVLHILNTKKYEKKARENDSRRKAEKDKLLEILSRKQDAGLEGLSEEEIRKKIEELD